jgi:citrate synthase
MSEKDKKKTEVIHSRIWEEEAEPDNPFAAAACYCHGYDVYGDLLGKASWSEYLYLLFCGEPPSANQSRLLEGLAVALANPGPRDHSVHAAMSGGVGGSGSAACLMAALAVGAGNLSGSREVLEAMKYWQICEQNLDKWRERIQNPPKEERTDVWTPMEHPPGFDPYGASCSTPVRQVLTYLARCEAGSALPWLLKQREALENIADCPLAMSGVAAVALHDLGFTPKQGEMLYLLLRLPGAAVHALEQRGYGWRRFPFFGGKLILTNDPGPYKTDTSQKQGDNP